MGSFHFLVEMTNLLYTLLPLLLLLIFLYKYWTSNTNQYSTKGKNLPPSPPKLPIIGNLHQIANTIKNPSSLRAFSQKYGDLMFIHLGVMPAIVISSAKMASEIFKTYDASISGRPKLAIARHMLYECKDMIFAPYGEHWRQLRTMSMVHILSNKRVQSFRRVREEELALMIENIKRSKVANLSTMFSTITNDIICRTGFGRKYRLDEDGVDFDQVLKDFTFVFGHHNIEDVLPWMGWVNWFNGFNAKASEVRRVFDSFVEKIVQEHAARIKEGKSNVNDDDESTMKDFVDILLQLQRDNGIKTIPIDQELIKGVLVDIFAAGTHTMNVTLEWAFTEMLRHPRVMKRVQEEVRGVVGEKEGVDEEDLEKLTYLKVVIKETFRLHPAVPLPLPRECTEDLKLKGYNVPRGTAIIINVWAIGRDPECWENADEFIPERFLDSPIDYKGQHFQLIPFGAGRRGCPGISFAIANIELVLANLVHRFDWSLPIGVVEESLDMTETPGAFPHKAIPLIALATLKHTN